MNEIMLEETRDTITVPATLMIRMLGTIHILRKPFYSTKLNLTYKKISSKCNVETKLLNFDKKIRIF